MRGAEREEGRQAAFDHLTIKVLSIGAGRFGGESCLVARGGRYVYPFLLEVQSGFFPLFVEVVRSTKDLLWNDGSICFRGGVIRVSDLLRAGLGF